MPTTLTPPRLDGARGLAPEPVDPAMELELTDDELESVVGGLARVHLPGTVISGARAPA